MATIEQLLILLEDTASLMKKTQTNLKKAPKTRLTKGYLQARMQCIDELWKTFTGTHQQLVTITPREKRNEYAYFLNDEYSLFEDLFLCIKADIQDTLSVLETSASGTQKTSTQGSSSMDVTDVHAAQVRLPQIQIPTYSGSYDEWPTFQDLFISLVHNNTSLSDVQKLHYLKCSVAGEAEALLRHVRVMETNYAQAWDMLKNRYGNKRIIVNSLLNRLCTQKRVSIQSANLLKTLLDNTSECLNTLNNLNIKTDSWDPIIIFLTVQKLDQESRKDWENYSFKSNSDDLPSWNDLKCFLESKFRTLELVNPINTISVERNKNINNKQRSFHIASPSIKMCSMCNSNHTLCHCKEFTKMSVVERNNFVKTKNLCFNCLLAGHSVVKCRVPMTCHICRKRHHTLLHSSKAEEAVAHTSAIDIQPQSSYTNAKENEIHTNTMVTSHFSTNNGFSLLATAMVTVYSETGHTTTLRALIDQGSQASFISEKAAQLLKVTRKPVQGNVLGIGSSITKINSIVRLTILSTFNTEFSLPIEAYVISKQVTTKLPSKSIITGSWPHLQHLQLADPTYYKPGSIDLLLGVQEYASIIQQDIIKGPPGTPCAQKTKLGWILFGSVGEPANNASSSLLVMHHQIDLDGMLKSMWELESDTSRKFTQEEKLCEEIYEKTHERNEEGRYIVNLPFKTLSPQSPDGDSKEIALRRFLQLERKFQKMPKLKEDYSKVIEEYLNLAHAEEIPIEEYENRAVYLSHHAVIRSDSESTPTRVVFDASCKGTNGISLNDELLVGPTLHEDLRSIMMRWRMHAICFVSDLKKMYRMVLVTKKHVDFQRFLWRKDTNENIKEYRLLTVTFGLSPAPYLAIKTLRQLAEDEGADFPVASRLIKDDFYVDDVLSGFDTVSEAIDASNELIAILKKGGFQLQKWSSNSPEFMKSIDPENRSKKLHLDFGGTIKALGILWDLTKDEFKYNLNLQPISTRITKRSILSDVQKLFDPLGWIAPCIVQAKILIQKLWLERIDWDEEVNVDLAKEWIQIREDFENLPQISVDRWIGSSTTNKQSIELHGFCDASEKAYASVVYCRIFQLDGTIITKLLAARTRVAPVKSVSLPRLELCGAVLLSKLLKHVSQAMRVSNSKVFAWTDSTIVLSWLCGEPGRWKQFVANRVVEILDNISNKQWHHVASKQNPADIASRGTLIKNLENCKLWWEGPEWLREAEINFTNPIIEDTELERRNAKIQANLKVVEDNVIKFNEFNSLNELLTTIVYTLRFIRSKRDPNNVNTPITTHELEEALLKCVRIAQRDFSEDIDNLSKNKDVSKISKIKTLNPYLTDGILRVGGRIRQSGVPESSKHPIILENKNKLTYLIIDDAHKKTLHGGTQLMLTYLRSKYWILKAKNTVKAYIHKCIICTRQKALVKTQLMGDLPQVRVTPARPFQNSGVDFAGPLYVLMSKGRGAKQYKAYIAIFICMATKAIHLELVGDLTSESFIGAFRRFVARRGRCTHIYSDHGRNFVGANKELAQAFRQAQLELPGHLSEILSLEGTQWHFIPPYSPNFGGLWEAGVKSVKYHLRRILTGSLTFEEMTTTLCDIEACLNSRPLTPIDTSDPDALEPLTPGHFLIGQAPVNIPNPDLSSINVNRLSRWQMTQKLVRDFWQRWQTEYLSRLQTRPKWLKRQSELDIGDIVLLKDEHLPPGKWSLGKIVAKHPGPDGHTRVYSVRYRNDVVKRSLSKICKLPIKDDEDVE